jgi:hypothetical protein
MEKKKQHFKIPMKTMLTKKPLNNRIHNTFKKTIQQSHSQYLQNTHRNKTNKPIILKTEIKFARRWKDHLCSNTARTNIAKMVYYEK